MVTLWFDGACPLCRREIAWLRRLDRHGRVTFIDVADLSSAGACPIDRQTLLERFHAEEGGKLLSGAAAFAAVWRALPLLRPIGLLARNPAVLRLLERCYLRFLRIRPRLQRLAGG